MSYFAKGYETHPELRRRIELTVSCDDCAPLPRVADAGQVVSENGEYVQIMHNGVKVKAGGYYGVWMAEIIERLGGVHEPQEELAFHDVVERLAESTVAPTIVEVGAFWSYYSLWALQRMPNGVAVLVEPDPNNLAVGKQNFALNDRTGTFIQAAVGGRADVPRPFECESDGIVRDVPTVSLGSLIEDQKLDKIDLLLVDVQGAEFDFLEGARDFIADRVRFALVSTHHHSISGNPLTHQQTLELLVSVGGHVIAEHTIGESVSGDGLIAVSFDPSDADLSVMISYGREGNTLFRHPLFDLAELSNQTEVTIHSLEQQVGDTEHKNKQLESQLVTLEAERDQLVQQAAQAANDRELALAEVSAMSSTVTWRVSRRIAASALGRRLVKLRAKRHQRRHKRAQ